MYIYKLPCVHAIILYLYSQITSMVEILSTTAHLSYGRWIYTFKFICLNLKKPFGCADKVQGFINYVNKIVKKKKKKGGSNLTKTKCYRGEGLSLVSTLTPIIPPCSIKSLLWSRPCFFQVSLVNETRIIVLCTNCTNVNDLTKYVLSHRKRGYDLIYYSFRDL